MGDTSMALPARRVHRGVRLLDASPIVTYDSANPDLVGITMPTETGVYDFKLDRAKGERLRYLLGRALDPASEPPS